MDESLFELRYAQEMIEGTMKHKYKKSLMLYLNHINSILKTNIVPEINTKKGFEQAIIEGTMSTLYTLHKEGKIDEMKEKIESILDYERFY